MSRAGEATCGPCQVTPRAHRPRRSVSSPLKRSKSRSSLNRLRYSALPAERHDLRIEDQIADRVRFAHRFGEKRRVVRPGAENARARRGQQPAQRLASLFGRVRRIEQPRVRDDTHEFADAEHRNGPAGWGLRKRHHAGMGHDCAWGIPPGAHGRERWCRRRSTAPVHPFVQRVSIVEIDPRHRPPPPRQQVRVEGTCRMSRNPKIVAKGALDQRGERLALLGRTGLGGADQAVVEVERRPHAEICVAIADPVNRSGKAGRKSHMPPRTAISAGSAARFESRQRVFVTAGCDFAAVD